MKRCGMRTGVIAAGVAAAVAAVVLLSGIASSEPLPPARDGYPFLYVVDLKGQDTVTYGAIHIPNPDAEPMQVVSVEPNISNLAVIDVVAVLPSEMEEHGIYHGGGSWPATDEVPVTRPAVGTELDSADFAKGPNILRTELQLLIGLRTTDGAEVAGLNGVTVTYELDGERITEDFPGAMLMCASELSDICDRDSDAYLRQLGLLK